MSNCKRCKQTGVTMAAGLHDWHGAVLVPEHAPSKWDTPDTAPDMVPRYMLKRTEVCVTCVQELEPRRPNTETGVTGVAYTLARRWTPQEEVVPTVVKPTRITRLDADGQVVRSRKFRGRKGW